MAITSIADVFVPEIALEYASNLEFNLSKNEFYTSGVIEVSPTLNAELDKGGKLFELPFWKKFAAYNITPTPVDEGTTLTPNKITAGTQVARRLMNEAAYSTYDVAGVLAGSNPTLAILETIEEMWNNTRNRQLVASVFGLVADNIANDNGDLVHDITTAGTTAFNADDALDTMGKLGEQMSSIGVIAVHPTVYLTLAKNELITTKQTSETDLPTEYFGNKRIVQDARLVNLETVGGTANTPVYYTIFFRPGCFQYGESLNANMRYRPFEMDRIVLASGGQDILVTRRVMGIHANGFAWKEATVTADFPSEAELKLAANWDRVVSDKKYVGFTVLKSLS